MDFLCNIQQLNLYMCCKLYKIVLKWQPRATSIRPYNPQYCMWNCSGAISKQMKMKNSKCNSNKKKNRKKNNDRNK